MQELSPEEIRSYQLELLHNLVDICEENNLVYYLCGGTLLGAIRHKGFIPWDDDIDIFMPRPDYEIIQTLTLKEPFMWTSFKKGNSTYPFLKIQNTTTLVKENNNVNPTNIWVDIFPIDGLFSNTLLNKLHFRFTRWFRSKTFWGLRYKNSKKTILLKNLLTLLHISPLKINLFICFLANQVASIKKFESSKYIGGVLWGYGPQERILKSSWEPSQKKLFENRLYNIPKCFDLYLKNLYGDYMSLPPIEKRIRHNIKAWKL